MKTTTNKMVVALFVFTLLFVICANVKAQTLSIKGNVTLNDQSSFKKYTVTVEEQSNDTVIAFEAVKRFTYELKYNHYYVVTVSRDGYTSKSICINTKCNSTESFSYIFDMNLLPNRSPDDIVYEAGGVFFNENKKMFDFFYD